MKKVHKRASLRVEQGLTQAERIRIGWMGAVLIMAIVLWIRLFTDQQHPKESRAPQAPQDALVSLPQLNTDALAEIKDATAAERAILEPEPFRILALHAQTLFPDHLEALGEPAIPFADIEEQSRAFRGKPVRLRGELIDAREIIRYPNSSPEYWCTIRTEKGELFFFASLRVPKNLFLSENFVLADGLYLKIYTQILDGERLTAPLVVGKALAPSRRTAAPARQLNRHLLAQVKDAHHGSGRKLSDGTWEWGEEAKPDEEAVWHMLNVAREIETNPALLESEFKDAQEIDIGLLKEIAKRPPLFRGQPFVLHGRVLKARFHRKGENPLRMAFVGDGFLGSTDLGRNPLHLFSTENFPLDIEGPRELLAWFLELEAWEDGDGDLRLGPVFVVAGERDIDFQTPAFVGQIVISFLGIAIVLAGVIAWLARRDKLRSELAARRLLERRQKRRGNIT